MTRTPTTRWTRRKACAVSRCGWWMSPPTAPWRRSSPMSPATRASRSRPTPRSAWSCPTSASRGMSRAGGGPPMPPSRCSCPLATSPALFHEGKHLEISPTPHHPGSNAAAGGCHRLCRRSTKPVHRGLAAVHLPVQHTAPDPYPAADRSAAVAAVFYVECQLVSGRAQLQHHLRPVDRPECRHGLPVLLRQHEHLPLLLARQRRIPRGRYHPRPDPDRAVSYYHSHQRDLCDRQPLRQRRGRVEPELHRHTGLLPDLPESPDSAAGRRAGQHHAYPAPHLHALADADPVRAHQRLLRRRRHLHLRAAFRPAPALPCDEHSGSERSRAGSLRPTTVGLRLDL